MLKIVALLFALAALVGITLATLHFRKKGAPLWLALVHLILAAAGLVTFIGTVVQHRAVWLLGLSLTLFVLAALGGFAMLALRLKKKAPPKPLIVIHALVAVAAFVLLLTRLPWGG